jgi:peptide/nickel transport system substrate-binding protein
LIFAVSNGEPATFDCHAAISTSVYHRIAPHYSLLIKFDPADPRKIVPDVATEWSVSPDGLTYTFNLRSDVVFHDGSKLTSEDVKATFDRLINPPDGVISIRKQLFNDVIRVDAPDPSIVVFHLSKPNAAMLTFIAFPMNCLYSKQLLQSDRDYPARKVMGSGPFRFQEYVPGAKWVGTRFDRYFEPNLPYLDGFEAVSMAGASVVNALASGQVQTDFRSLTPPQRDRIVAARGDNVTVETAANPSFMALTFNTTKPPFNDERVRRALNLAIDRWGGSQSLKQVMYYIDVGGFQRAGTPYARSPGELAQLPGYGRDMEANRMEARRLLAEAGQSSLTATLLNLESYSPLGVFLIDQWRRIGVTVTQDIAEGQRFFASRTGGSFDMIIDINNLVVDEPSLQLSPYLSFDTNRSNISRAVDKTVDELYEAQSRTLSIDDRKPIVRKLEAYLMDKAYTVPLFWSRRIITLDRRVHGYVLGPDPIGQDLSRVWLVK